MLYFANPTGGAARQAMRDGLIGFIDTPAQGNRREAGVAWCADNGCYTAGDSFDLDKYLRWLAANRADAGSCVFATAPDVVGDAAATWERSKSVLPRIRALGYPAALVAQDGLTVDACEWDAFDVLFIGGSTGWKLGGEAAALVGAAKARGKWVHMGRVNSRKRFRYANAIGCDSVDGTFLVFGPDVNLPKLLSWTDEVSLFETA